MPNISYTWSTHSREMGPLRYVGLMEVCGCLGGDEGSKDFGGLELWAWGRGKGRGRLWRLVGAQEL